MGSPLVINESLLNQLFSFIAFLFPFLASVAFTLLLRRTDKYNSLINQIHIQKQELKKTEYEIDEVRTEVNDLVKKFNHNMEEKMEDLTLHS